MAKGEAVQTELSICLLTPSFSAFSLGRVDNHRALTMSTASQMKPEKFWRGFS